ncbi:MAG TPA: hypothetical protein VHH36_01935 [Candidatus Thermoplasmatota archaeon]|nr:hypothetical protein [Candidatus Thermoplasmatota archaeon]
MKNQGHVGDASRDRVEKPGDRRDLEARNEAMGGRLPMEEPRDVHKAGRGVVGPSMGGAVAGRRGSHVEGVSNRERKPRGRDKDAEPRH